MCITYDCRCFTKVTSKTLRIKSESPAVIKRLATSVATRLTASQSRCYVRRPNTTLGATAVPPLPRRTAVPFSASKLITPTVTELFLARPLLLLGRPTSSRPQQMVVLERRSRTGPAAEQPGREVAAQRLFRLGPAALGP